MKNTSDEGCRNRVFLCFFPISSASDLNRKKWSAKKGDQTNDF